MFLFLSFFKIRILPWCSVLSLIDKNLLFSVDDTHPVKCHVDQCPGKKGEVISFKIVDKFLAYSNGQGQLSNSDAFLQNLSYFPLTSSWDLKTGPCTILSSVLSLIYSATLQITGFSPIVWWLLKPVTFLVNLIINLFKAKENK